MRIEVLADQAPRRELTGTTMGLLPSQDRLQLILAGFNGVPIFCSKFGLRQEQTAGGGRYRCEDFPMRVTLETADTPSRALRDDTGDALFSPVLLQETRLLTRKILSWKTAEH